MSSYGVGLPALPRSSATHPSRLDPRVTPSPTPPDVLHVHTLRGGTPRRAPWETEARSIARVGIEAYLAELRPHVVSNKSGQQQPALLELLKLTRFPQYAAAVLKARILKACIETANRVPKEVLTSIQKNARQRGRRRRNVAALQLDTEVVSIYLLAIYVLANLASHVQCAPQLLAFGVESVFLEQAVKWKGNLEFKIIGKTVAWLQTMCNFAKRPGSNGLGSHLRKDNSPQHVAPFCSMQEICTKVLLSLSRNAKRGNNWNGWNSLISSGLVHVCLLLRFNKTEWTEGDAEVESKLAVSGSLFVSNIVRDACATMLAMCTEAELQKVLWHKEKAKFDMRQSLYRFFFVDDDGANDSLLTKYVGFELNRRHNARKLRKKMEADYFSAKKAVKTRVLLLSERLAAAKLVAKREHNAMIEGSPSTAMLAARLNTSGKMVSPLPGAMTRPTGAVMKGSISSFSKSFLSSTPGFGHTTRSVLSTSGSREDGGGSRDGGDGGGVRWNKAGLPLPSGRSTLSSVLRMQKVSESVLIDADARDAMTEADILDTSIRIRNCQEERMVAEAARLQRRRRPHWNAGTAEGVKKEELEKMAQVGEEDEDALALDEKLKFLSKQKKKTRRDLALAKAHVEEGKSKERLKIFEMQNGFHSLAQDLREASKMMGVVEMERETSIEHSRKLAWLDIVAEVRSCVHLRTTARVRKVGEELDELREQERERENLQEEQIRKGLIAPRSRLIIEEERRLGLIRDAEMMCDREDALFEERLAAAKKHLVQSTSALLRAREAFLHAFLAWYDQWKLWKMKRNEFPDAMAKLRAAQGRLFSAMSTRCKAECRIELIYASQDTVVKQRAVHRAKRVMTELNGAEEQPNEETMMSALHRLSHAHDAYRKAQYKGLVVKAERTQSFWEVEKAHFKSWTEERTTVKDENAKTSEDGQPARRKPIAPPKLHVILIEIQRLLEVNAEESKLDLEMERAKGRVAEAQMEVSLHSVEEMATSLWRNKMIDARMAKKKAAAIRSEMYARFEQLKVERRQSHDECYATSRSVSRRILSSVYLKRVGMKEKREAKRKAFLEKFLKPPETVSTEEKIRLKIRAKRNMKHSVEKQEPEAISEEKAAEMELERLKTEDAKPLTIPMWSIMRKVMVKERELVDLGLKVGEALHLESTEAADLAKCELEDVLYDIEDEEQNVEPDTKRLEKLREIEKRIRSDASTARRQSAIVEEVQVLAKEAESAAELVREIDGQAAKGGSGIGGGLSRAELASLGAKYQAACKRLVLQNLLFIRLGDHQRAARHLQRAIKTERVLQAELDEGTHQTRRLKRKAKKLGIPPSEVKAFVATELTRASGDDDNLHSTGKLDTQAVVKPPTFITATLHERQKLVKEAKAHRVECEFRYTSSSRAYHDLLNQLSEEDNEMVRRARESVRMQKLRDEEEAKAKAEKEMREMRAKQEQEKRAERKRFEKELERSQRARRKEEEKALKGKLRAMRREADRKKNKDEADKTRREMTEKAKLKIFAQQKENKKRRNELHKMRLEEERQRQTEREAIVRRKDKRKIMYLKLKMLRGWVELYDDAGNVYFENTTTGDTLWEKPDADGKKADAIIDTLVRLREEEWDQCRNEGATGWAWLELYDDGGALSYYNELTGETSESKPFDFIDGDTDLAGYEEMSLAGGVGAEDEVGADDAFGVHEGYDTYEYDQQGYQGEGGGAQGWQEWSAASSSSTWAQRVDESGNVYYENAETGETQWEQPASTSASFSASTSASLASGYEEGYGAWEEAYDENGSLYYVNATTGEVSYNY